MLRRALPTLLLGLVTATACLPARSLAQTAPTVATATAREAPVVQVVPLTGTVTSTRVARLSPAVAGRVAELNVDVGDRVERGDTIMALDSELARYQLSSAEAETAQAEEELADARRRLNDAQRLSEQRGIARSEVMSREAEVRIDAAAVERLEAEEGLQRARLRRHTLDAPFAGVVSAREAEVGEWMTPGDTVVELVATDSLLVDFQVPQRHYPEVERGQTLDVTLDALPGRSLAGRIETVVPVSDPSARTFRVRVALDDQQLRLAPGMSAQGKLRLTHAEQGVVVSRDALLRYPDGRITVWVVNRDEDGPTVSERQVTTGLAFDGQVEITEGLEPGTELVVEGNEALQPGQRVEILSSR